MSRRQTGRDRRHRVQRVSAATFSPADIADLEAWYRETYAAGTWSDLSGNGRDLTQATGTARPTQVSRAGQLALSFDGGDRVQGAFGSALSQPITVYSVIEPTTDFSVSRQWYDGDDTNNRVVMLLNTTPMYQFRSAATTISGGTPTLAIHATCHVANGASSAGYADDFVTAVASGDGGAGVLDGLTVGGSFAAAAALGYVWEILVYSGAHDAATRKLIGDYMTARYDGLTVTT